MLQEEAAQHLHMLHFEASELDWNALKAGQIEGP